MSSSPVRRCELPPHSRIVLRDGEPQLIDGRIVHANPVIVLEKTAPADRTLFAGDWWDPQSDFRERLSESLWNALRAIVPLALFMVLTLRVILRESVTQSDTVTIGLGFALVGMLLFGLGIQLGLTPLGTQLGSNVPATFTTIAPWGVPGTEGPMFDYAFYGKPRL